MLFPDDGQRHELIDGEHFVTPSPNLKHQAVLGNVATTALLPGLELPRASLFRV